MKICTGLYYDVQGVADTLVERLQAKYEFYATHVGSALLLLKLGC